MDDYTEGQVEIIEAQTDHDVAVIEAQADADAERLEAIADTDDSHAEAVAEQAAEAADIAQDGVVMLAEAVTALTGAVQQMGGRLDVLETMVAAQAAAPAAPVELDDDAGTDAGDIDLTVLDGDGDGDVNVTVDQEAPAIADEQPGGGHWYYKRRKFGRR